MKICFFFSDIDKGEYTGQAGIGLNIAKAAGNEGCEVSIISNSESGAFNSIQTNKYKLLILKGVGVLSTYIKGIPRTIKFLIAEKPDVVHVHGSLLAVFICPILLMLKIPFWVSTCEVVDMHPGYLQSFIKFAYARANKVIVTANIIKQQLAELGIENKKIDVVRLGLRKDFFQVDTSGKQEIDIVFWGDSTEARGFDVIFNLIQELPNLRFRILLRWKGADCNDRLNRLIAGQNNSEIYFYPYEKALVEYLKDAKLVVLPFRFMGVRPPLSIIEAMAMGKCVITTPMSGNSEVIENGDTGFLCNFDSSWDDSIALVNSLLKNDDVRRDVGVKAKLAITTLYSEDDNCLTYMSGI